MSRQDPNDKTNISGGVFAPSTEQFQVRSASASVGFETDVVQPPSSGYIGVDDRIIITALACNGNVPVFVNLRILRPDGIIVPMQFSNLWSFVGVQQTQSFELMEGWLLSCTVTTNSAASQGQFTFVSVALYRGTANFNNAYMTLCSGIAKFNCPLSWPAMVPQRDYDGPGTLFSTSIGPPAAGTDISFLVPVGQRWQILSFRATLTTAVAVANRFVTFVIDDGANIVAEALTGFTQAASVVNTYDLFDTAAYVPVPVNLTTSAPTPSGIIATANFHIKTVTANIQAADQWTAGKLLVRAWPDTD